MNYRFRSTVIRMSMAALLAVGADIHRVPLYAADGKETPTLSLQETANLIADLMSQLEQVRAAAAEALTAYPVDSIRVAPKRDFGASVSGPVKIKLFRTDPLLLEQKFVAKVTLSGPGRDSDPRGERGNRELRGLGTQAENVMQLFNHPVGVGNRGIWPGAMSVGSQRQDFPNTQAEYWARLIDLCPEAIRPDAQTIVFFASQTRGHETIQISSTKSGTVIDIYAPTVELAESRVRACLSLLDNGLFLAMQRACHVDCTFYVQKLNEEHQNAVQTQEQLAKTANNLLTTFQFNTDIISQLRSQRILLDVELAGQDARFEACLELLKDPKQNMANLQVISEMKLRADVDRIGTRQKVVAIDRMIKEGDAAEAKRRGIQKPLERLQYALRLNQQRLSTIRSFASAPHLFTLPTVDSFVVAPIEWTGN